MYAKHVSYLVFSLNFCKLKQPYYLASLVICVGYSKKVEMIFFNHLARHDLSFGPDEFVNNDTGRSALITTTAMSV